MTQAFPGAETRGKTRVLPFWREAWPLALLAGFMGVRFFPYLLGGVFIFRDAGYFFLPLREIQAALLRAGEFPLWNEFASNGRALSANPNGAVFWPLSFLLAVISPSQLALLHVASATGSFYAALRWLNVGRAASLGGSLIWLFSGVFQTLPVLFTTLASTIPLPIALAAMVRAPFSSCRSLFSHAAISGVALGLSFLGGEPVIAASGAAGVFLIFMGRTFHKWFSSKNVSTPGNQRESESGLGARAHAPLGASWFGAFAVITLLAGGVSAIQLIPSVEELQRSGRRSSLLPEDGALFWSVHPARVLTLLEPRLTGDPFAENEGEYWGAGTFDAKNPYFYDLAIGLIPLLLALSAFRDPRGRGCLALAVAAACLSFGRFLPGYATLAGSLTFIRYPEKWWVLATLSLAAAAATGIKRILEDPLAMGTLARITLIPGVSLAFLAGTLTASPETMQTILWRLHMGTGQTSPESLRTVLTMPLLLGIGTAVLTGLLALLVFRQAVDQRVALAILATVFVFDATRRVIGTCPAGEPRVLSGDSEALRTVLAEMPRGRFYDDGADDREIAVERAREAFGFDPLRPITGSLWGIRYSGENDIDRMTSKANLEWSRQLSRMPWSALKLERLRKAGVSAVRTSMSTSNIEGLAPLAAFGTSAILRVGGTRPEFSLVTAALEVPPGRAESSFDAFTDPAITGCAVEVPGAFGAVRPFGEGTLSILKSRASHASVEARVSPPGGLLLVTRTFDPNWKAYINGHSATVHRADGLFCAVPLPPGKSRVELRYENRAIWTGAVITLMSLISAIILAARGWQR